MTNYLEVTNLSKSFDSFQLHNISFTLPKGYIMGLIGPNGSGKTTTIKLILNMLKRTGGTVKVMGLDNIAEEQKVKSELGVVFDTNYFSDDWKVSQIEKSISVFYPNWDSQKFADMLRKFHIAPTKKVKELSKGMQMKLMLACAFSYDAKLLILDEPTSGLDPVSRDELLKILSEYPHPQAGEVVGMDSHQIPVLGHFNAGRPPSAAHHHIKSFSAVQAAVIVRKVKADVVAVCLLVKNQSTLFHRAVLLSRRHKLHIACFHASVKSSLISLFLLSPQNHRFCGVPQLPVFMSWATSAV
jgi:ABC-type Na+ transport system ATPase subunit NatA